VARLRELVVRAVQTERRELDDAGPVVIVHSGDIEAFGAAPRVGDFSGISHLDSMFSDTDADGVVAVYGNHDVWPGTVPLFHWNGWSGLAAQKQAIADHGALIGPLPPDEPLRFATAHEIGLVFVPLSTVHSSLTRGGVLANGRLSPHPPGTADVLGRVRSLRLRPSDLNVAVMHHPPHFYRPITLRDRARIGRLERSRDVADELHDLGVNLVLSGHRHRLDPPFGHSLDAAAGHQPPLPPGMAQLVALSPTLHTDEASRRQDPAGTPPRGLCVYRVVTAPSDSAVTIQRLIHPTDGPADRAPTVENALIPRLPLGPHRPTKPHSLSPGRDLVHG
jgi:hypothetical protein